MPASGSSIFTDADGYQATLRDILDLLVLRPREFNARLTWVELANVRLLRGQESSARVAQMMLPSDEFFVTFGTQKAQVLIHCGLTAQFGEIVLHSRGEQGHQRTSAAYQWGLIALAPAFLFEAGRQIAGLDLAPSPVTQFVRPPSADHQRLLQLHAQAGRLAEINLERIANPEVARALEQEVTLAFINCLAKGTLREDRTASRREAEILLPFEAILTRQPHRLLGMRELCDLLGVSENVLRASCSLVLGMSPTRYQRLRRLKLIRAEILAAKPVTQRTIEQAAARFGFPDLHRFIAEYWRFYDELPPMTTQKSMDHQI